MTDPTDHDELRTLADKLDDIAQRAEEEHISGVRPALRKWDTDRLHAAADVLRDDLLAERDAERAARERAETENGRLRALTEGDPYSIYYEAAEMRSELMHLRRWKLEATEVIESWELVYEALGDVGGLGQRRSDAVLAEVLRMKAELDRAQLRSIEASNPGIDMEEVRRVRLAYPDHERHETVSRAKYGASLASDIAADGGAAVAEGAEDRGQTDG